MMRFWATIFFIISVISATLALVSDRLLPKIMFFVFMVMTALCVSFRNKYDKV